MYLRPGVGNLALQSDYWAGMYHTPAYLLSNTTESSYWPCNQTTVLGHAKSALLMYQPYPSQHTPLIPNITESSYCAAVTSSHSFFQCPCRIFQSAFPLLCLQPSTSEKYVCLGPFLNLVPILAFMSHLEIFLSASDF